MNIKEMDLIVTRDKTPVSWVIRWRGNTRWSHICIGGENKSIYTTTEHGFSHVEGESYLKGKTYAIYRMPELRPVNIDAGLYRTRKFLGDPYDYIGPLSMFFTALLGKGINAVKTKHGFCSKIAALVYEYMGFPLIPHEHRSPEDMLPEDCVRDARFILVETNDPDLLPYVEETA